jgi:putative ABC transport system permease protein
MNTLLQEIRFGLRVLRKNPGFTAAAVLTLALGIGANSAIFSLVSGLLFRPLPYAKPDQLVSIRASYPRGAFVAMREQVHTMNVATYAEGHECNLTGTGEPVRLTATLVSAELFSVLGANPELGRAFHPGEDAVGKDNFVVISHALWQDRFAGDSSIVGRVIQIEGEGREVLGVMPQDFRFPSSKTQIWLPLHNDPSNTLAYWAGDFMPVIARLRPNATIASAAAETRLFQSHVGELFPFRMPPEWNADLAVVPLQSSLVAGVRNRLLMLLGAVVLILLIACANVANLILSRAATREKEFGIRAALGAGRDRIVRQLLTESVLLGVIGGACGMLVASVGLQVLKATLPSDTPRLMDARIDWRVLLFTGGLSLVTGAIFGLAPALQSARSGFTEVLKSGARGSTLSASQRVRSSLAIAEIGLAALLIIAAGLLVRSFWALSRVNPGFRAEHVVTARITPNQSFCNDPSRCLAFYRNVLEQVRSSRGVSEVALVNTLPLNGRVSKRSLQIENLTSSTGEVILPLFWLHVVTPDYFRVMGIPLQSGRWFSHADESVNAAVAVLSAESAERFWPGQEAVGKHIRFAGDTEWRTVVGVIGDVRDYDLQRTIPDYMRGSVYVPYNLKATGELRQIPSEMTIAVRTAESDSQVGTMLLAVVSVANPEVPVSELKTMRAVFVDAAATPASTASLFIAFAALALVLGMVGIYGVLAFLVSRRTREIGIRLAMGAQRQNVFWMVLKEGAKFYVRGVTLGLIGAFATTRLLASELYGVSALDPLTYVVVAVVMALVTLLACCIPARRAMRVDPLAALRCE